MSLDGTPLDGALMYYLCVFTLTVYTDYKCIICQQSLTMVNDC